MVTGDFQPKSHQMNPEVNNFTMNPSRNQVDRFYSHNIQNMSMQYHNDQSYLIKNPQHYSPITPRDQFYGLHPLPDGDDVEPVPQAQMLVTPPPVKTPASQNILNTENQQLENQHQLGNQESRYDSQLNGQESLQSMDCSPPRAQASQSEQTVEGQGARQQTMRSDLERGYTDPSTSTVRNQNQQCEIVEDSQTENMTEEMETARHHQHLPLLDRELTVDEVRNCEQACDKYVMNDEFEIELQNLNEVNEYFRIFKDQILQLQGQLKTLQHVAAKTEQRPEAAGRRLQMAEGGPATVQAAGQEAAAAKRMGPGGWLAPGTGSRVLSE